jgi:hypothetical protein
MSVKTSLVMPGTDVRHRHESAFNAASGELWMQVARYCNTRDHCSLAVVSAQANAGCRRYAHLALRLPPGWTVQILGEEMRWLQKTLGLTPPPSGLLGLERWMSIVATSPDTYRASLNKVDEDRRSYQLSPSNCLLTSCLCCCCLGGFMAWATHSVAGFITGGLAAESGPEEVQDCCYKYADWRGGYVIHHVIALREAWTRPLVAPTYGSINT